MRKILCDYLYLARKDHIKGDVTISLLVGTLIATIAVFMAHDKHVTVTMLVNLVSSVITAFSILAGFSTTTLTIFVTSNSPVIQELKTQYIKGKPRLKIEQIIVYFTWAIALQLLLLLISIAISLLLSGLYKDHWLLTTPIGAVMLYVTLFAQTTGVAYAISLSLRNVSIVYSFLISDSRK